MENIHAVNSYRQANSYPSISQSLWSYEKWSQYFRRLYLSVNIEQGHVLVSNQLRVSVDRDKMLSYNVSMYVFITGNCNFSITKSYSTYKYTKTG